MKNFNNFLNTVDIEAIYVNTFHTIDKSAELEEMVAKTSVSFSIALLKAYHEWLSANDDQ